ncbi:MAG: S-adenosylmethionine:tRNA ribosyltransferase-isomerase, partial [Dactylosporangium sp.]|nr:S-adenosylmethionine:tRNA ribosyltransferase-isomerase [Dactylosporangium sp.]
CPTAGLHLRSEVIESLRAAGHEIVEVTLHIGYGTWKSLATEFVDEHEMDAEHCEVPVRALEALRRAKSVGRPVVAVGTSSVRTLETFADEIVHGTVSGPLRCATTLFITPGFRFRVVDHLITNFAYPQTPIMSLTAAFVGDVDKLFSVYREAVDHGDYLFFTYGDAMFIR